MVTPYLYTHKPSPIPNVDKNGDIQDGGPVR